MKLRSILRYPLNAGNTQGVPDMNARQKCCGLMKRQMCSLKTVTLAAALFLAVPSGAQTIARFQLTTKGTEKYPIPVMIDLDAITYFPDSVLQLMEVKSGRQNPVGFQIEANGRRQLHWIVEPSKIRQRVYELVKGAAIRLATPMKAVEKNGAVVLGDGDRDFLQYNFKTVYPPAGIDTTYKRSGFIHPLNTPGGKALTRINAPDHYHHWGMWNPWTHVLFEKDTVDFWNLRDRKGTVRFAGFSAIEAGGVYAGFSALHEHVAFKKGGGEKAAISELQTVRIYRAGPNSNYYLMDFTAQLSCASSSPVLLLEYRYGGLGIRATELWNRSNSETLTSEGKNRKEADGSLARWCLTQGSLGNDYGGLEMMSFPANYNHPEPLRVWPENMNNRGDVFLNFSATKNKNWLLEPGKEYILRYRFLVYNGRLSKDEAEEAWQSFANPPIITIKTIQPK